MSDEGEPAEMRIDPVRAEQLAKNLSSIQARVKAASSSIERRVSTARHHDQFHARAICKESEAVQRANR